MQYETVLLYGQIPLSQDPDPPHFLQAHFAQKKPHASPIVLDILRIQMLRELSDALKLTTASLRWSKSV